MMSTQSGQRWSRARRPGRRRALVLGVLAGLAPVAAATAAPSTVGTPATRVDVPGVATHQVFTVPTTGSRSFHIAGRGWGHGHGMSQYGAEGAARQGWGYRRILSFYYPGTTVASSTGMIRVLITADTTLDVQVAVQPGLSVTDLGSGTSYPLPAKPGVVAWRLNVDHGRTVIGYKIRAWHRYAVAPDLPALTGDGEFHAAGHRLTLITPSGRETVHGALRAATPPGAPDDRDTVNVLSIDNYVRGVVPDEMPTSWHPAAVRAQAVAARTYGLFERAENAHRYYQICDTGACQVYGGVDAETSGGNAAVDATAGLFLGYGGAPAFTQFASSDGGWTAAGGFPYLPAKRDPSDGWSGNPVHTWTVRVTPTSLERRYPSIGTLRTITITRRTGDHDAQGAAQWQGRVIAAKLTGTKGSVSVGGSDLQAIYGLRSTWFMPK